MSGGKLLRFEPRSHRRIGGIADGARQPHCALEAVAAVVDVFVILDQMPAGIQQKLLQTLGRLCESPEGQRMLFERIRMDPRAG